MTSPGGERRGFGNNCGGAIKIPNFMTSFVNAPLLRQHDSFNVSMVSTLQIKWLDTQPLIVFN